MGIGSSLSLEVGVDVYNMHITFCCRCVLKLETLFAICNLLCNTCMLRVIY
jgi:hypothetical protein